MLQILPISMNNAYSKKKIPPRTKLQEHFYSHSEARVLHFSTSREVSLRNSVTTINAYYNHMCHKYYFLEYKKEREGGGEKKWPSLF